MSSNRKTLLAIGLWAFIIVVVLIANWDINRKTASKEAALEAAERKETLQIQANARRIAANPKLIAAEREKNRKIAAAKQKERNAKRVLEKQRAPRIEKFLKDSFGYSGFEPSWYLAVKRKYTFDSNTINVHTNLDHVPSSHPLSEEWNRLANATCMGVSSYLTSRENPEKHFNAVRILSTEGRELAGCP